MKKINKKKFILYSLIFLSAIVMISLVFNDAIYGDEGYTMWILKKDFIGMTIETAKDVHPPLYYYICKILTIIFGYSATVVRLASVIPAILTNIFIVQKSEKLFGKNSFFISIMFILLFSFIPRAFLINVELRMYSMAAFFVTCSGVYAYEVYKHNKGIKSTALFILSSLLAAYTHYYAALTVVFIYLALMVSLIIKKRENYKFCLKIVVITLIGYLPWLPVFYYRFAVVKNGGWWLESFSINNIVSSIKYLYSGDFAQILMIIVFMIIVGIIYYNCSKKRDIDSIAAMLMIGCFSLTIIVGIICSFLLRPMFLDRYMYPGVGLLLLGVCIALTKIEHKDLITLILFSTLILSIPYSYNSVYTQEYGTGVEEFKKFLKENITDDMTILTDATCTFSYYLPNNEILKENNDNFKQGIFITDKGDSAVHSMFPNSNIENMYQGNIDRSYNFTVYKIS